MITPATPIAGVIMGLMGSFESAEAAVDVGLCVLVVELNVCVVMAEPAAPPAAVDTGVAFEVWEEPCCVLETCELLLSDVGL